MLDYKKHIDEVKAHKLKVIENDRVKSAKMYSTYNKTDTDDALTLNL